MPLTDGDIQRLQEAGRRRGGLSDIERKRHALAPFIDTGTLTDEEVRVAYGVLTVVQRDNGQQGPR